jgi:hypothetical protein
MSDSKTLRQAGILTYLDRANIIHYRYAAGSNIRVRRFKQFRKRVAKLDNKTPGVYAARLIALDMVLPTQIGMVAAAKVYRHLGRPNLEWNPIGEKRIDRRIISSLTISSCVQHGSDINHSRSLDELLAVDPAYKQIPANARLAELECDMCQWAFRHLTGPMAAHVTQLAPIFAVPRETLVRAEFKMVLQKSAENLNETRELELASFYDAAIEADGPENDETLLRYAIQFIAIDGNKTDQENLKSA